MRKEGLGPASFHFVFAWHKETLHSTKYLCFYMLELNTTQMNLTEKSKNLDICRHECNTKGVSKLGQALEDETKDLRSEIGEMIMSRFHIPKPLPPSATPAASISPNCSIAVRMSNDVVVSPRPKKTTVTSHIAGNSARPVIISML
mmetsp:Transcript_22432/g.29641  ORF Transcript_22432/g.29641 Transcript_22432/m.29641 type:complete len:146 (+) Transcript_22432:33-470(+)